MIKADDDLVSMSPLELFADVIDGFSPIPKKILFCATCHIARSYSYLHLSRRMHYRPRKLQRVSFGICREKEHKVLMFSAYEPHRVLRTITSVGAL